MGTAVHLTAPYNVYLDGFYANPSTIGLYTCKEVIPSLFNFKPANCGYVNCITIVNIA